MASTISGPRLLRHTIASDEVYERMDSPSMAAFKDLYHSNEYAEGLSPAEAAFAFDDNMAEKRRNSQAYHDLVAKISLPVDSGYASSEMHSPVESKSLAQMYEDHFQRRERPLPTLKERIKNESPVVAHLRTNVIVKDEFTLVTDLSHHLANRFARTEAGIMISVDHSQCIMLARSFEPTYVLTISAVPSELRAESNKLNAAHIQSFMSDILSVPPERGVIRFEAVAEENLAMNGTTVLGSMERMQTSRPPTKRFASASNIGSAFDPSNNRGISSPRSSTRATERVANPAPLSSNVIAERTFSLNSVVSAVSNNDYHSAVQSPVPQQGLSDVATKRGSIDQASIISKDNPAPMAYPKLAESRPSSARNSPARTPTITDWRPTAPTPPLGPSRSESVMDVESARRDTVLAMGGSWQEDGALPPPPISRHKMPASTPRATKRKSLLSMFSRR